MIKQSKFELVLTTCTAGMTLEEKYDPSSLVNPWSLSRGGTKKGRTTSVKTLDEATEWGRLLVERFNATRREGEPVRVFVSVELRPRDPAEMEHAEALWMQSLARAKRDKADDLENAAWKRREEAAKLEVRAARLIRRAKKDEL